MSAESQNPKQSFFKLPVNFADLSDSEIDELAEKIFAEFLNRQKEEACEISQIEVP